MTAPDAQGPHDKRPIKTVIRPLQKKLAKGLASKSGRFAYVLLVSDAGEDRVHAVSQGLDGIGVLQVLRSVLEALDKDRFALKAMTTPGSLLETLDVK